VYHTETYYHNFYGNTYPKSPVCACVWSREIIVLDTHGMDVYIGAYVRQYILIKSRWIVVWHEWYKNMLRHISKNRNWSYIQESEH